MTVHSIAEVLQRLDQIVTDAQGTQSPMGYFAALYRKVTRAVQQGIAEGSFEDGPRMERLDVVFAQRYLDAYDAFKQKQALSESWRIAFEQSEGYWPIVLQHLLLGIHAHISLDLGIAAATVSRPQPLPLLKNDFDQINALLASLVQEVQEDLVRIWPTLFRLLQWSGKVDDFIINFSMQLARDGAWRLAEKLVQHPEEEWPALIAERDQRVAAKTSLILPAGRIERLALGIIRLGERGTVAQKIAQLA